MKNLLDRHSLILFAILSGLGIAVTSYLHGRYDVALPNPLLIVVASGIAALGIRSCFKSVRR